MKVALVRVDSRLVHGQIVEAWVPYTRASALVVLNDEAAASKRIRSIMSMCVPEDLTVVVGRPSEAAAIGARADLADRPAIVLVATPKDALVAYDAGLAFARLNLGNLHFAPGKRQVTTCVSLGDEDRAALRALEERGVAIEVQAVPRERPRPYHELAGAR